MKAVLKENVNESMFLLTTFCHDDDYHGVYDIDGLKKYAMNVRFSMGIFYVATPRNYGDTLELLYQPNDFDKIFQIVEN